MLKKKTEQKLEMGYCPFESRYNGLYRDTGLGRCGLGAAGGPGHGQDSATIWPSLRHDTTNMACDTVDPRARASNAHEGLAIGRLGCDTNGCIGGRAAIRAAQRAGARVAQRRYY